MFSAAQLGPPRALFQTLFIPLRGKMGKPVAIASFSFPHEAHVARASLESAGIPAVVADEHTINMQWLYSNALGGVKVLVPPEYVDEALKILECDFSNELDSVTESGENICPSCNSENTEYHIKHKKQAFVVFIMLGFPLFFYKRGFKCNDCGHFWKK